MEGCRQSAGVRKPFRIDKPAGTGKICPVGLVDNGTFEGLTRDGQPITKTHHGDKETMMKAVKVPPTDKEIKDRRKVPEDATRLTKHPCEEIRMEIVHMKQIKP
jgi:hypothetical protein